MPTLTQSQWIEIGIQQGWCGPSTCSVHKGIPISQEEENRILNGEDTCIQIVRLYPDKQTKEAVEDYFPPESL